MGSEILDRLKQSRPQRAHHSELQGVNGFLKVGTRDIDTYKRETAITGNEGEEKNI